jgi:hypothetical protein
VQQGDIVRVAVGEDQLPVGQQRVVDLQADPDIGLPGHHNPELAHPRAGRLFEPEAPHEPRGDLLPRAADKVLKGLHHIRLDKVGAQLDSSAGVGEGLELLGLDEGAIQVEDEC